MSARVANEREIELTPKAEEDLEAIWDYSLREFGCSGGMHATGRIAAVFDVLAMHDIGSIVQSWGDDICTP